MDQHLDSIVSTQNALLLMQKFDSLGISELAVTDKYQRIIAHYSRDLDTVARIYQKNKTDPPIGRDLPPISGIISLPSTDPVVVVVCPIYLLKERMKLVGEN